MLTDCKELREESKWITGGLHVKGCNGRLGSDHVRLLAAFNNHPVSDRLPGAFADGSKPAHSAGAFAACRRFFCRIYLFWDGSALPAAASLRPCLYVRACFSAVHYSNQARSLSLTGISTLMIL